MNSYSSNDIIVFPNPVNDHMKLSTFLNDRAINIYDIAGHLTFHVGNVIGNRVDVSKLNPGIYYLQIEGENAQVKFVKL